MNRIKKTLAERGFKTQDTIMGLRVMTYDLGEEVPYRISGNDNMYYITNERWEKTFELNEEQLLNFFNI